MIQFQEERGLPTDFRWVDVYQTQNGVLFSTQKGVYRFNSRDAVFYPDSLLGIPFKTGNQWVFPIVEDSNSNLWISSGFHNKFEKMTAVAQYKGKGKPYALNALPFIKINHFTVEAIFAEKQIIWFGGDKGLVRFDFSLFKPDKFIYPTFINRIIAGPDTLTPATGPRHFVNSNLESPSGDPVPVFQADITSIAFEYSAPFFTNNRIEYSYFLENFDESWSPWTPRTIKEYTSLNEGEYIFHVKARNEFGYESKETSYTFTVKPPFHRTYLAYFMALLLVSSFLVTTYRIRGYRFSKTTNLLEQTIRDRTDELVEEKEKAEDLIANMLPGPISDELKRNGRIQSKKYEMVSVMFCDIQGFTSISELVNPEKLVEKLNELFFHFDLIMEQFGLEKIKTMGDGYLCAGGIPEANSTNPIDIILAGMKMQEFMAGFTFGVGPDQEEKYGLRIGIHTGPIITGIVGRKKYSYDIWGVTVNNARQMETMGKVNKINISADCLAYVTDFFVCHPRGKLPLKHKGFIDMYFVDGILPELADPGNPTIPNQAFHRKLTQLRLNDLRNYVWDRLTQELPRNLYYHNPEHTLDVTRCVEEIASAEGVNDEQMHLLMTAGLLHDIGFIIEYDNHELNSARIAREVLPRFKYSQQEIALVCELILATRFNHKPRNHMEEIICDADLDYLGREDFIMRSRALFKELYEQKKVKNIEEWNRVQIRFFEKHRYFTQTEIARRTPNKADQLEQLLKLEQMSENI